MTTTADLRRLTMEALVGATEAGDRVFAARSWPIAKGDYPLLYLHSPAEDMESLGRNGAPQFTVTAVIRVSARIQLKNLPRNAAAAQSIDELEVMQRQIKSALINYSPLMARLQQFAFVRSEIQEDGEGALELAELVMDIGMEFYQGPEEFYPTRVDPLQQTHIINDLTNVFDISGTYSDQAFPDAVNQAPRTAGPDGRAEAVLDIDNTP